MPCRSDYLEPNFREAQLQRTAQLYIYVLNKLGYVSTDPGVEEASNSIYGRGTDCVPLLCEELKGLTESQLNEIVYNS